MNAAVLSGSIEELRSRDTLRTLENEEEGCSISRLPKGVYGFTYSPDQSEIPVFSKKNYHSFELHKLSDGTACILGFVTEAEALEIKAEKGGASIRLFPDPWQASQTLVRVPLDHMVAPKRMPREDGNPFPFTIA